MVMHARLDTALLARAADDAGLVPASLAILPLDGERRATAIDPDRSLYPASMIKVPLAAVTLCEIADGRLTSLDARVTVDESNMTANDLPSPMLPGYETTIRELLHLAITRSDNVATNVLFDVVGRERATQIAQERLGLHATRFARKLSGSEPLIVDPGWDRMHRNAHTAEDAMRLFTLIADGAVPFAALLRDMLGAQEWNNKLSAGLRPGDRFLHKTGDTGEVTHDGGILYTEDERAYVIVAYTGLASSDEHNARFGPFMRAIRTYL
jgi:beta-lactamase class A